VSNPPPISSSSPEKQAQLVRSTNHEVSSCAIFSILLTIEVQISSSAPYSHISSAYVLPLMWKTKFHTLSKQQRDVTGHKTETLGRVVHNLLAVAP